MRMLLLSVILLCCRRSLSNGFLCCEVKVDAGIVAGVREEERMFLLKLEEQAFGQCDAMVEVCIEGLVKLFCCSFWYIKTLEIGGLVFRCFPIGGIGVSMNLEDVCLLKSPPCLLSFTLCAFGVLGEFGWRSYWR